MDETVGMGRANTLAYGPGKVTVPHRGGAATLAAMPGRDVAEIPSELTEQEELCEVLHQELNALSIQLSPVMFVAPEPEGKPAEPSRQTIYGQRVAQSNMKLKTAIRAIRTMRDGLRI